MLALLVLGTGIWATAIDPVWATPLNTALLLLTAVVALYNNNRTRRIEDKAHQIHQDVSSAASAAASAASAAADSARIAKELGGNVRHVDVPLERPGGGPTS